MNRAEKIQCQCGGKYRSSDKAKHLKTKKHMKSIKEEKTAELSPLDKVFNQAKDLSISDKKRLIEMLNLEMMLEEKESPFDKLQAFFVKELGACPFKNYENYDVTDEQFDEQQVLENKALALLTDDVEDLYEDAIVVFELKNYSDKEAILGEERDLKKNDDNVAPIYTEFKNKNKTTFDDQYNYLIEEVKKINKKKTSPTDEDQDKIRYLRVMSMVDNYRKTRAEQYQELVNEVEDIVIRRTYLKDL